MAHTSDTVTHTHKAYFRCESERIQSSVPSLTLSQRGEATVGNMNYKIISGCKMEINLGDYTSNNSISLPMILYCSCVKDSRPYNSPFLMHVILHSKWGSIVMLTVILNVI